MKDDFKKFIVAAGARALRTFCQTFIATIGTTAAVISDVNWGVVFSASLLSAVISVATSVVLGLPEAKENKENENEH